MAWNYDSWVTKKLKEAEAKYPEKFHAIENLLDSLGSAFGVDSLNDEAQMAQQDKRVQSLRKAADSLQTKVQKMLQMKPEDIDSEISRLKREIENFSVNASSTDRYLETKYSQQKKLAENNRKQQELERRISNAERQIDSNISDAQEDLSNLRSFENSERIRDPKLHESEGYKSDVKSANAIMQKHGLNEVEKVDPVTFMESDILGGIGVTPGTVTDVLFGSGQGAGRELGENLVADK